MHVKHAPIALSKPQQQIGISNFNIHILTLTTSISAFLLLENQRWYIHFLVFR
jgi:hypothetical protein